MFNHRNSTANPAGALLRAKSSCQGGDASFSPRPPLSYLQTQVLCRMWVQKNLTRDTASSGAHFPPARNWRACMKYKDLLEKHGRKSYQHTHSCSKENPDRGG